MSDTAFLDKLQDVIRQRLADAPTGSYTAKLASQGMLKVAQKLGEEGVELALAACRAGPSARDGRGRRSRLSPAAAARDARADDRRRSRRARAPSSAGVMQEPLPVVLIPGLLCTARLYLEQIPALWQLGPVTIADHTRDDSMAGIARRLLAQAPPRFALVGLSMGGYIAFEVLRQAPERVAKLALLDTSARPDLPEQIEQRKQLIDMALGGSFNGIARLLFPRFVAAAHQEDRTLKRIVRTMAEETGAEAFVRQQTAIIGRVDSRSSLGAIACPTLV